MTIGIEAERANEGQKTGVEHYAKQLILHLAGADKKNNYILYLRTKPQDWFLNLPGNFTVKVMPFPLFWTQLRVSWEMLVRPVDALLVPASALPLFHPANSIVTIHDLAWKFYPRTFTFFNRVFLEWSTRFAVKFAGKIIAVSEATKKDLIKFYKVDAGKITVVHHGYEKPNTFPGEKIPSETGGPYVLFLSTLQPRKNLAGLIDAFRRLKSELPELPHKLLVVGRPGWKYEKILKKIDENKGTVVYLNYVDDGRRLRILSGASVLALPSFYEGFGMQILEAFAAGVPVAASGVSSMPEVAGEAAVYFNPESASEIKDALKSVLLDKSFASSLIEKGKERLRSFSWEKCAKETLTVLGAQEPPIH